MTILFYYSIQTQTKQLIYDRIKFVFDFIDLCSLCEYNFESIRLMYVPKFIEYSINSEL